MFSDLFFPVANGIVTLCLLYAALSSPPKSQAKAAWLVLAAAQLSYTIGDAIWAILEIGLHEEAFPSVADVFYVLYSFIFAAGIFLLPSAALTSSERIKLALDEGVVVISTLLIYWTFFISPILPGKEGDFLTVALSMTYPAIDLVLLFALIDLLFRRPGLIRDGPLMLLAAATIIEIFSDAAYGIGFVEGTYISYDLAIDSGWLISYALTGLAGIVQAGRNQARHMEQMEIPKIIAGQNDWTQYLPYIWAGAAFLLLSWSQIHPLSISVHYLTLGVGCIISLIFIRQIFTLKENRHLYIAAQKEIEIRKIAEGALLESEGRFRRLAENAPDIITRAELYPRPHLTYISPAIEKIGGYTPEEIYSSKIEELIHPDDRYLLNDLINGEMPPDSLLVMRWRCKDGKYIWIEQRLAPIFDQSGHMIAIEGFARDITERVEADAKIKSSLKEKEVMLREIHHRVKNNLQVISSLLSLQSNYTKDKIALETLKESQNRIKSMALVHERLYRSPDLARINISAYIEKLGYDLANLYKIGGLVTLKICVEDLSLGVDKAIPCGLIINELITNSMKHAFPDKMSGEVFIGLSRGPQGRLVLIVRDNGIGLPENIDFKKARSLGLMLVTGLVNQLDGTIEVSRDRGTQFRIEFTS